MEQTIIHHFLVIFLGLSFGSLATLLSYRLPRELKVGMVRSQCPNCQTALGLNDLVPLVSWVLSRGQCRHCHVNIHWRYPIIEIITGALFYFIYIQYGATIEALLLALLGFSIIVLCVTDFEHYIIPDEIQVAMAILGIAYHWITPYMLLTDSLAGMILGLFIGFCLQKGYKFFRKRDGLGTGDVKLLTVAGIWLGISPMVPLLFFSGMIGIMTAVLWRILGHGERFPFGPAIAGSLFVMVLYPEIAYRFWHLSEWLL